MTDDSDGSGGDTALAMFTKVPVAAIIVWAGLGVIGVIWVVWNATATPRAECDGNPMGRSDLCLHMSRNHSERLTSSQELASSAQFHTVATYGGFVAAVLAFALAAGTLWVNRDRLGALGPQPPAEGAVSWHAAPARARLGAGAGTIILTGGAVAFGLVNGVLAAVARNREQVVISAIMLVVIGGLAVVSARQTGLPRPAQLVRLDDVGIVVPVRRGWYGARWDQVRVLDAQITATRQRFDVDLAGRRVRLGPGLTDPGELATRLHRAAGPPPGATAARFWAGQPTSFGAFTVDAYGISKGNARLLWRQVERVLIDEGTVRVVGDGAPLTARRSKITNLEAFSAIVEEAVRAQR